jgi:hypothetical protein
MIPGVSLAQDVSTGFEFTDVSGSFTLGTPPYRVTFAGGQAKFVGSQDLARTGSNSWVINAGQTGTITFETPADQVDLYFKEENSSVISKLSVFDTNNQLLGEFDGLFVSWRNVDLNSSSLGSVMGKITLQSSGLSGTSAMDDFTFSASRAPEDNCIIYFTRLDMDLAEPARVGSTVTFTVNAADSCARPIYYRFSLIPDYGTSEYDPNVNFTILQDFSLTASATHSFQQTGGYVVVVFASNTQSLFTGFAPPIIGGNITVSE